MPKVSVVIPTYDHRDHVLATLNSVFAQDYTDYEVIVVNDGSPDDTDVLLRPLVEAGRIRYLRQENQGQGAARNCGLRAALGEYVALLDDDDLWPPDKLRWQVEVLDAQPEVVLVYGPYALLQPDGSAAPGPPAAHPNGHVYRAFLEEYCIMSPGQALIRRRDLDEIGGFDPEFWGADDWDLYLRLAPRGEFRYVERTALLYRLHENNASRNAIRHFENSWRAIRKHAGKDVFVILNRVERSGPYFVPSLRRQSDAARRRGDYVGALKARLYAALCDPLLLARLRRMARWLESVIRPGSRH